ncbi:Multiple RNA-binding domain-containing protein 1 [Elasticomyces elasticus]|nr:Multiple RNA-binding domain-containing protein 1 [Elasticomyces elasticus]
MDETLSSRIFVKGLPPTFTEAQFRQHFARDGAVTDAKIFQSRRIGYIGYKTHEDAQKAVKYVIPVGRSGAPLVTIDWFRAAIPDYPPSSHTLLSRESAF